MSLSDEISPREQAARFLAAQVGGELGAAYRRVFDGPDGKLVLADILKRGRLLSVSVEPGDALTTGLNDGRRALALEIVQLLRWTELDLLTLSHERTARQIEALEDGA